MLIRKILPLVLLLVSVNIYADYSLDSNNDGLKDIWVKEIPNKGVIVSSDTNYDGDIDSKLTINESNITIFEETDYNLDGVMDNFYYYKDGVVIRQEVDSNYDNKIDIWVYVSNGGTAVSKYEKDTDFDGVIDKVKEFEVEE